MYISFRFLWLLMISIDPELNISVSPECKHKQLYENFALSKTAKILI